MSEFAENPIIKTEMVKLRTLPEQTMTLLFENTQHGKVYPRLNIPLSVEEGIVDPKMMIDGSFVTREWQGSYDDEEHWVRGTVHEEFDYLSKGIPPFVMNEYFRFKSIVGIGINLKDEEKPEVTFWGYPPQGSSLVVNLNTGKLSYAVPWKQPATSKKLPTIQEAIDMINNPKEQFGENGLWDQEQQTDFEAAEERKRQAFGLFSQFQEDYSRRTPMVINGIQYGFGLETRINLINFIAENANRFYPQFKNSLGRLD